MKNIFYTFISTVILLTIISTKMFSQDVPNQATAFLDDKVIYETEKRICTSADMLAEQVSTNPVFKANREIIEEQTEQYIKNPTLNKSRSVIKIPVVVHVVYNLAVQNISDAQIFSQIDILNKDYRKLNIEIPTIPSVFSGVAADCEIEFSLAHTSPTGDSTSGITRTYTTTTSFGSNSNVKYNATGGCDAWPSNKYLNIWVTKLNNGILGFSTFPGNAAATDGVVISYKAFGTGGVASAPYNKGRTATHEIGHWLNVYHIWGDDGGSCNGSDLVNDTPNQGSENYGCPTFPKVTSCSPDGNGDMFMNYMDYTNDACMKMFTNGQKLRMMAIFATGGARASILTSNVFNYPIPPVNCGTPTNLAANNITGYTADLTWNTVPGATNYIIRFKDATTNYWFYDSSSTNSKSLYNLFAETPIVLEVQAVCPLGAGAFTSINFTTPVPFVYYKQENKVDLSFYPNPASQDFNIRLNTENAGDITYNIYNTLGQLILTKNVNTQVGNNYTKIDVSNISDGMYILEYRSGIERKLEKITIKK